MRLLVTAFEPFGGETVNAAQEVLARMPEEIGDTRLVRRVLPVAFDAAAEELRRAVAETAPDAVLCLGQAGGRTALTPERVAVNLRDARIPDNAGARPVDEPVVPGGPAAYFATLPVRAMTEAIRAAGLPAELSNTAGTYVCNTVMYTLLDLLAKERPGVRGGFLHLPRAQESGLTYEALVRGVEAAVRAIAEN